MEILNGTSYSFLDSVGEMESNQEGISQDLIKSRAAFRRSERSWMAEKETLLRKLQLMQNFFPSPALAAAEAGGFFTDARGAARIACDRNAQRQIQKLNVSQPNSVLPTQKSYLI